MQLLAIARQRRAPIIGAALAALFLFLAAAAEAQTSSPYRVTGIPVSAEAENAVAARELALQQGKRDGLTTLVDRLSGGSASVDTSGLDIDNYVASFEVLSEQVGPTSYGGEIEVIYRQDAVNPLLPSGRPAETTKAEGTVIVPLWERGGEYLLWQSDNAWKSALDRNIGSGGVIVPLGDLEDVAAVRPNDAVGGNELALGRLSDRYGAGQVVVVKLVGDEVGALRVDGQRFPEGSGSGFSITVVPEPGETFDQTLARAAQDAGKALAGQAVSRPAPVARYDLSVAVQLTTLDAWGNLLRSFERFDEVQSADVRRFTRDEAIVRMAVFGEIPDLVQKFGRTGWWLNDNTGSWRLEPGTPPPPPIDPSPDTTATPGTPVP